MTPCSWLIKRVAWHLDCCIRPVGEMAFLLCYFEHATEGLIIEAWRTFMDISMWLVIGIAMIVVAELLLLGHQRRLLLLDPRRSRFFVELGSR